MISLSFVFVSIVGMVISTLPALQYQARDGSMVENPWLSLIETISIAWFTLEYFLRLLYLLHYNYSSFLHLK